MGRRRSRRKKSKAVRRSLDSGLGDDSPAFSELGTAGENVVDNTPPVLEQSTPPPETFSQYESSELDTTFQDAFMGTPLLRPTGIRTPSASTAMKPHPSLHRVMDVPELADMIAKLLDPISLINLTRTCKGFRSRLQRHWNIDRALSLYVQKPVKLRKVMRESRAVIFGAFGFWFFERQRRRVQLHIAVSQIEPLRRHLVRKEGYREVESIKPAEYPLGPEVFLQLEKLTASSTSSTGALQISLLQGNPGVHPFGTVLTKVSSSKQLNLVTADQAVAVFPVLTFLKRQTCLLHNVKRAPDFRKIKKLSSKSTYIYELSTSDVYSGAELKGSGSNPFAQFEPRRIGDSKCWTISFGPHIPGISQEILFSSFYMMENRRNPTPFLEWWHPVSSSITPQPTSLDEAFATSMSQSRILAGKDDTDKNELWFAKWTIESRRWALSKQSGRSRRVTDLPSGPATGPIPPDVSAIPQPYLPTPETTQPEERNSAPDKSKASDASVARTERPEAVVNARKLAHSPQVQLIKDTDFVSMSEDSFAEGAPTDLPQARLIKDIDFVSMSEDSYDEGLSRGDSLFADNSQPLPDQRSTPLSDKDKSPEQNDVASSEYGQTFEDQQNTPPRSLKNKSPAAPTQSPYDRLQEHRRTIVELEKEIHVIRSNHTKGNLEEMEGLFLMELYLAQSKVTVEIAIQTLYPDTKNKSKFGSKQAVRRVIRAWLEECLRRVETPLRPPELRTSFCAASSAFLVGMIRRHEHTVFADRELPTDDEMLSFFKIEPARSRQSIDAAERNIEILGEAAERMWLEMVENGGLMDSPESSENSLLHETFMDDFSDEQQMGYLHDEQSHMVPEDSFFNQQTDMLEDDQTHMSLDDSFYNGPEDPEISQVPDENSENQAISQSDALPQDQHTAQISPNSHNHKSAPPISKSKRKHQEDEDEEEEEDLSLRYFALKNIIAEDEDSYLIDWCDINGAAFMPTWEPKDHANDEAVRSWERKKVRARIRRRKSRTDLPGRRASGLGVWGKRVGGWL